MSIDKQPENKIVQYIVRSRQAIETGKLVLAHED
jgi:hypothetical protein